MKIAFTICSNNYLARAKVTAETFTSKHPNYKFFVFLVDTFISEIDYDFIPNVKIIAIKDVVLDVEELAHRYNIIELNTAVKPGVFNYLISQYSPSLIIFLDPDLYIYDHFLEIESLIENGDCNLVVTPHFCSPIDDGKVPSEIHLSVYGLFNLGFLALKNSIESKRFLNWWHDRLMKYCYIDPGNGMFTDQLWVNHAPIYFDGVHILKHLGYNVANWNLYERMIEKRDEVYYVNEVERLKFFHFSHYKFLNPYIISSQQNRHVIDELPHMREIIDQYQSLLIDANQDFFATIPCYYQKIYNQNKDSKKAESESRIKMFIRKGKNKFKRFIPYPIKRLIKRNTT